jgi:predicted polyphosphate/ATP-dependent NAD kinase
MTTPDPNRNAVLVCGGRDFRDTAKLRRVLDGLDPRPTLLIHGRAVGADTLAGRWAESRGIPVQEYPADWDNQGKAAGAIRNRKMLKRGQPNLVIAFAGGAGTADMVKQAIRAGVRVIKVPS